MQFEDTPFNGLSIVRHLRAPDARGVLVKPWIAGELAGRFGPAAEAYFSFSEKGVFRGLHYQHGDMAQNKYVVCLAGSIEDVALDLRPGSQTHGRVFRLRLDALSGVGVIIPGGFAHGIFAHEPSTIVNFCDKPYAPGDEGGVNWTSLDELSDLAVIRVSDKDASLPGRAEVLA
jgi:dTDP-4-dehydrorhamnose 3,5-epimerase